MARFVAIVEPYSSGALLAERFTRVGFKCIALHLRELSGTLSASFRPDDFDRSIVFSGRFDDLVRELQGFDLAAVVPGQEAGVDLAHDLSLHFGLAHNDPALAYARRDKYNMHQVVAAAGHRSIEQVSAGDFAEIEAWLERRNTWPVVLKPVLSGGTDGVRICDDIAEARAAFEAEIGKVNLLGFPNERMVAQELIEGTEFAIDTVSCNGRHHIVSVARYAKERGVGGGPIYRGMRFIPPEEWAACNSVIDYTIGVLDALGVWFGPSHTEVFLDEKGPVLVESGARLCGAMVPRYVDMVSTVSPLDLAVASYTDQGRFAAMSAQDCEYTDHLEVIMLKNSQSGEVLAMPGKGALENLETTQDVFWYAKEGGWVKPTNDLLSSLGLVFLIGPADRVSRDIDAIHKLEESDALIEVA